MKRMISALCVLLMLCGCASPYRIASVPTKTPKATPKKSAAQAAASPAGRPTSAPRPTPAPAPTQPRESVAFLLRQLSREDGACPVYADFGYGANQFTQRARTGEAPDMDEAWTEGPRTGLTCVRARAEDSPAGWGGWMFVGGALRDGKPSLSLEQPAPRDMSAYSVLSFWARGAAGGEQVTFYYGTSRGEVARKIALSLAWTRYELPVDPQDADVRVGFGWAVDVRRDGAAVFYLDDIRYEGGPVGGMRLIESYAPAGPGTDEAVINNFAYVYDNALAALALLAAGEVDAARRIGDALVFCAQNDRAFSAGRLRNAYLAGGVAAPPGWETDGKTFAQLPGFYSLQDRAWYEDEYADGSDTGNMAWAMLALNRLADETKDERYLQASALIGRFVADACADWEKGYFTAGYEGFDGRSVKRAYAATEHQIDLMAAYGGLYALTHGEEWLDLACLAAGAVHNAYDEEAGFFRTGWSDDRATASVTALDVQAWAALAFSGMGEAWRKRADAALAYASAHMMVDGLYGYSDNGTGVWHEGSAQMALALGGAAGEGIRRRLEDAAVGGGLPAADRDGVWTGFYQRSGQKLCYNRRAHLGATAWLVLLQYGYDPFMGGLRASAPVRPFNKAAYAKADKHATITSVAGDRVHGEVSGFDEDVYALVLFIRVRGSWWGPKPYWNQPLSGFSRGGFSIRYLTGGVDHEADEFLLFVVPKEGYARQDNSVQNTRRQSVLETGYARGQPAR